MKLVSLVPISALCFAVFFCVTPFVFADFSFTQSLRLGSNTEDVRQLQIFLNKDPDTRVALSGVGSSANETTYFGLLTMKAVMRFQTKYKEEILFPSGLVSPTGFVGPATIKKINSLLLSSISATNNQNTPTQSQNSSNQTSSMPVISEISKVSVSIGDTLTITGRFSGSLRAYFDEDIVSDIKIVSPTQIDIVVPNKSGIRLVSVSNEYGDSRADFPMLVFVADPVSNASVPNLSQILKTLDIQNNIIHNKAIDPANQ